MTAVHVVVQVAEELGTVAAAELDVKAGDEIPELRMLRLTQLGGLLWCRCGYWLSLVSNVQVKDET